MIPCLDPLFADHRKELAARIARFAGAPGTHGTLIPHLRISRFDAPTECHNGIYEPSLAFVAQGAKEVLLAGSSYVYDEAHYLLTAIDLPVASRVRQASVERPYLSLSLSLDLRQAGELMAEIGLDPAQATPDAPGLAVSQVAPPLLDAALHLVGLLAAPQDIPILAPLVEREILYHLLTGPQGARLRHLVTRDSQTQRIAKVIAWLRRNYARPLRIEALAHEANMSVSSLQHHFRHLATMSPLQFQKQLRLQEARRLMLAGADAADAADAGHRVGYESPSHFSRDYRRLYGAPPLRDVAGLRNLGRAAGA
ncbi:MAG: AraC family transcriptional regulator [Holophaga sp.]|nr:AraC family transcriptional regulator [Holophaga sp.]